MDGEGKDKYKDRGICMEKEGILGRLVMEGTHQHLFMPHGHHMAMPLLPLKA